MARTAAILSLPEDIEVPYPIAPLHPSEPAAALDEASTGTSKAVTTPAKGKAKGGKRKSKRKAAADDTVAEDAEDGDDAGEVEVDGEGAKKARMDGDDTQPPNEQAEGGAGPEGAARAAAISASFGGVLDADSLRMPLVPTREEMSQILLDVRKKALRKEYGV